MPGVNRIPVAIVLRMNFGDGEDRTSATTWGDAIERLINDPAVLAQAITGQGFGLRCDYIQLMSADTRWDESTFEASFEGDALVVRTQ
jgi:hypothetical protein